MTIDENTLLFPVQIAPWIGLDTNEINSFKGKGCRFLGKKTCVAWVREYLRTITEPEPPSENGSSVAPGARLPRSISSKSGARSAKNG